MDTKNIAIAILTVAVLGFGYTTLFQEQSNDNSIAMKEECRRVGSIVHQGIVDEFAASDMRVTMMRAEYAYNKELDTCLYTSGVISTVRRLDGSGTEFTSIHRWVMDSFTNNEIFRHYSVDGEDLGISYSEFDRQKQGLFDQ